jgi:hypothetical protein
MVAICLAELRPLNLRLGSARIGVTPADMNHTPFS